MHNLFSFELLEKWGTYKINSKNRFINFPRPYLTLLQAASSVRKQYKYVMLIENYLYQDMLSELQGSYFRFDTVAPFIHTNKTEYKAGEDVLISIGFMGVNSNKPYEIVLNGRSILIDNIESAQSTIQLKAEGKGSRTVKGLLRYQLNHEKAEAPFEVTYEVR